MYLIPDIFFLQKIVHVQDLQDIFFLSKIVHVQDLQVDIDVLISIKLLSPEQFCFNHFVLKDPLLEAVIVISITDFSEELVHLKI